MRPKCGPNAARKWPEFEIFWPEINPSKFTVTRAQPVQKLQSRNPTRTMKKVARPSPTQHIMQNKKFEGNCVKKVYYV